MEDKESTDTGSLGVGGGNSEIESPPPVSSVAAADGVAAAAGGGGGGVVPPVMNMAVNNMSMGNSGGVVAPTGIVAAGGGGSGDMMVKKKRGRPRKYDADGNLRVQYKASPASGGGGAGLTSPGFGISFSSPSSGEFSSSSSKRGRGRPPGSGNWQLLASLGELFANTAGADFTPHVVTVHAGEDVAGKILSLAQKGPRGLCILSANGTISNVTIRQPGSSVGLLTYEGRFEILSLTGSFTTSDNGGMKSRTGGLSITLAGPDGRVVGGGVAGVLLAATPIQIVIGSFMPYGNKMHKRKHNPEPKIAPVAHSAPRHTVTAATPISQAAPESNICRAPMSQLPVQGHGEADNSTNNKDIPNSASTDSAEYNNSGPALDQTPYPYPDINVSIPME